MTRSHYYGMLGGTINAGSLGWVLWHPTHWRLGAALWCAAMIIWLVGLGLADSERQLEALRRSIREHS